jgi:hypothetical protein
MKWRRQREIGQKVNQKQKLGEGEGTYRRTSHSKLDFEKERGEDWKTGTGSNAQEIPLTWGRKLQRSSNWLPYLNLSCICSNSKPAIQKMSVLPVGPQLDKDRSWTVSQLI